ncbi:MAG: GtrA family protein [Jatrophihabitans sp.]|uniref:GtrA family protein n=1 Tax=Jatrophihabitans sp. TaxID=1932789 RepID=UPI003F7F8677
MLPTAGPFARRSTLLRRPAQAHGAGMEALAARTRPRLHRRADWLQFARFATVGASGYLVNLAAYTVLVRQAGWHYAVAATLSFLTAASWNYMWNRLWTFRRERGSVAVQGLRFLIVSVSVYAANLAVLTLLVAAGLGAITAQALAIVLVTPGNFLGNKWWSFRRAGTPGGRTARGRLVSAPR